MSKPRGHVSLNGKDYIITDGSYQSKMVPLFRPQLQIEGISHEALDQYLYWVQETWNKVSNMDALLGFWKDGGYGAINGLNNSEEGKLKLQYATSLCDAQITGSVLLFVSGSFLYLFNTANGVIRRMSSPCTWTDVTYNPLETFNTDPGSVNEWDRDKGFYLDQDGTYREQGTDRPVSGGAGDIAIGKITAVDNVTPDWLIFGTDTGWIFTAQLGAALSVTSVKKRNLGSPITSIRVYRSHAFITYGTDKTHLSVWPIDNTVTIGDSAKYSVGMQGKGIASAVWSQAVMVAAQAGTRGSLIMGADIGAIVDSYELFGGFQVDSIAVFGGHLIYAGHRTGNANEVAQPRGLVYTFKEILSERFDDGPDSEIDAMMPLATLLLVARPKIGGLQWLNTVGGGRYAQHDASTDSRIRSIAHFGGDVYYTIDGVGVIRVNTSTYRTSGTLDSGWFHGGFPELLKDWADVSIQTESPVATGQTVSVSVRKEGDGGFTLVGSMAVGETSKVLLIPVSHQQSKRLETRITLGSDGTNTPTVTSAVTRYRTLPVQKRGWAFTVRVERGITFADGTRESREPETIADDLFDLQTAGQVNFATMLEPTVRKVYVTNVQLASQLVGQQPVSQEEGFVSVEVLEV